METLTQTKWNIDTMHSEVLFKVKHLVISTVTGSFRNFSGSVTSESDDFNGAIAEFEAETASIDTNVADRDAHLKSDDFFASATYPNLTFKNGVLTKLNGNQYELKGQLTIKGITKDVTLKAELGGLMVDGYGQHKAGFEISGTINRKDFGLTWSMVTEAGGIVVSDDVKLLLNIQVVRS